MKESQRSGPEGDFSILLAQLMLIYPQLTLDKLHELALRMSSTEANATDRALAFLDDPDSAYTEDLDIPED